MSVANAINQHETPIAASTSDVATPASNTAAQVSYAAGGSGVNHCISGIAWSYSGDPTGGNLLVEDGAGNTIFSMDITKGGAGVIYFTPPKKGSANTLFRVTLAAGGSGITGKVSVLGHWTEGPAP
jgi:hypothetical protein